MTTSSLRLSLMRIYWPAALVTRVHYHTVKPRECSNPRACVVTVSCYAVGPLLTSINRFISFLLLSSMFIYWCICCEENRAHVNLIYNVKGTYWERDRRLWSWQQKRTYGYSVSITEMTWLIGLYRFYADQNQSLIESSLGLHTATQT